MSEEKNPLKENSLVWTDFLSKLKTKFVILFCFVGILILFITCISGMEKKDIKIPASNNQTELNIKTQNKGPESLNTEDNNLPNTENLSPLTDEVTQIANSLHMQVLKNFEDLKSGYISVTTFLGKIDEIQSLVYEMILKFAEHETEYQKDNTIQNYNFLYSKLALLYNCLSEVQKLSSEKEIKKIMINYINNSENLENKFAE